MGRAWVVGAAAAFLALLLYYTALAWADALKPEVLPALILLLAYVGIGAAAGHAAVSLTGGATLAWPAVLVVAGAGALLLGWGPGANSLHPMLSPVLAGAGAGACTAVGGWLGLVLPNLHRSAAPPDVLADQPTVELRVLPNVLIANAVASLNPEKPARRERAGAEPASYAAIGPEILDFGS
jgi:hypothetical protein